MSDIIANAQKLLGGTTPGEWVAIPHDDWDNAKVIAPDDEPGVCEIATMFQEEHDLADAKLMAASKSHAQALAEESYEYSFQIKYADGWETACNDVTDVDEWWPDKSDAEWAANNAYDPYIDRPIRLVRRRVSPVEVIE